MPTRAINSIKVGRRHRKDLGDVALLADSIQQVGMLHAVVVDSHNRLIAGRRRLAAAKLLGWKEVPVRVIDLEQIVLGEFAENACRKDFVPSEIAAIAKALTPLEEGKAHQRKIANLKRGQETPDPPNCRNGENGEARKIVARYTGIGHTTLGKIIAIVEAAEAEPTLFSHLKEEMDAEPRAVHRCHQKLKATRQQLLAQDEKIEPVNVGKFKLKENQIICGDCREILPKIKAATFHAAITDPTFGIGHVYNGKKEATDDPESYWRWFEPIYREILRVVKPGGFCAFFQTGRYMRYFWDWFGDQKFVVYAACREPLAGWKGGQPISCCWSPVVMFFKGGRSLYRATEFVRARNWFVSNSKFDDMAKLHPCSEPLDQCEELVRSFTCQGALVLDPFCGVGTIPIACTRLGRRFVGMELEKEYVQVTTARMKQLGKQP